MGDGRRPRGRATLAELPQGSVPDHPGGLVVPSIRAIRGSYVRNVCVSAFRGAGSPGRTRCICDVFIPEASTTGRMSFPGRLLFSDGDVKLDLLVMLPLTPVARYGPEGAVDKSPPSALALTRT